MIADAPIVDALADIRLAAFTAHELEVAGDLDTATLLRLLAVIAARAEEVEVLTGAAPAAHRDVVQDRAAPATPRASLTVIAGGRA